MKTVLEVVWLITFGIGFAAFTQGWLIMGLHKTLPGILIQVGVSFFALALILGVGYKLYFR